MLPPYNNKIIYDKLKELDVIAEDKLNKFFKATETNKEDLSEILVQEDLISPENIGIVIAEAVGSPYISLAKTYIKEDVLKILPEHFADTHKIVAFSIENGILNIATPFINNKEITEIIQKKAQMPVKVFFCLERDINEILPLYKQNITEVFKEMLRDAKIEDLPVEKVLDTIIEYAYDNKASDIHMEPKDNHAMIRYRVDGVLKDIAKLPKNLHDQIINKIKVECGLRTDEHLSAQDGKMKHTTQAEELDIRVSIVPLTKGENCVMRLLASHIRQYGLNDLGLEEAENKKVEAMYKKPYGMILSTGPTGSGKTTSMYAILRELNTREKNITTIEDPVEYDVFGMNQIQVNTKTNLTFAEGLKSILRQDPDIIFVGEIRDPDTAYIAVNAAMTGHLVLSTLHTNDASTTIPRLLDMGIEPFLIASTVNIIIAQRLVRKICTNCRYSYTKSIKELTKEINDKEIIKTIEGIEKSKTNIRLYKGKGCVACGNTGYSGRIGIFEILEVTEDIRKLIVDKQSASKIAEHAIKEGMETMLHNGIKKVVAGTTTIEEVLRVTKDK